MRNLQSPLSKNYLRLNSLANALFRNTLSLSLICCKRCLLLCLQTFFLGVTFADRAFVNNISVRNLYKLKLQPDQNKLSLKWKESMENMLIFCKSICMIHDMQTLSDLTIITDIMCMRLKKSEAIIDIDVTVLPYSDWRDFEKTLNNSSRSEETACSVLY